MRGRAIATASVGLMLACGPSPSPAPTTPPTEATDAATEPTEPGPSARASVPREPPADATRLRSEVVIRWLSRGAAEGPNPRRSDRLELRFSVWDEDDALVGRSPTERSEILEASWLPAGWMLAMEAMHEGDHAQVWVPATLAYPEYAGGPRGALRIDVELVAIHRADEERPAEVPLLTAPPNALRTASGLAFVVLREGTGTVHPRPDGKVTVHYEGWTSDGNRFDSSRERGRPTSFPLAHVIEGWREAVPLMVEGEKTRFWIPPDLAYGDMPGRPQGTLVFDIELISIDE